MLENASISNIIASGSIMSSGKYTGSIAGEARESVITDCVNEMNISGDGGYTGGICGNLLGGTEITLCENNGNIDSSSQYLGGIAGNCESGVKLEECINNGIVSSFMTGKSEEYVGGITGKTLSSIKSCINGEMAVVSGGNATGGITGYVIGGTVEISDCHNRGSLFYSENTVLTNIGGIAGVLRSGSVTNCINYETGSVMVSLPSTSAALGLGGIVGQSYSGCVISDCVNLGSVNCDVSGKGAYVGGICGNSQGKITGCVNKSGNISALYGGGIVGRCGTESVTLCYNTGDISADTCYIGGIAGRNDSATVSDCFNIGIISGKNAAGLVCLNNDAAATLRRAYSIVKGAVTNATVRTQNGKVENVYYMLDEGGSLLVTSQFGTSVTAEELIAMPEGLNSENVWEVKTEDETNKYPYPQFIENPFYGE